MHQISTLKKCSHTVLRDERCLSITLTNQIHIRIAYNGDLSFFVRELVVTFRLKKGREAPSVSCLQINRHAILLLKSINNVCLHTHKEHLIKN